MKRAAMNRDNRSRIAALPRGKKHWNWSEKPSLLTLHKRLHRRHGSAKMHSCSRGCGLKAIDWALRRGHSYSDDIRDYEPLCRKCHIALDNHPSKVDRSLHKIIRDEKGRIKTTLIIHKLSTP